MKINKSYLLIHLFIIQVFLLVFCLICSKNNPFEPEPPCISDQPVEDTTRVYLHPTTLDTIYLEPHLLYVKFNLSVTDTNLINSLIKNHNLVNHYNEIGRVGEQYVAFLETKNKRAEYYFTPYGKENFCNFGADTLVEYSFGIFWSKNSGTIFPGGNIIFKFSEGTSDVKIDSFFNANGLRFWHTSPDFPIGIKYTTSILPTAPKNVIDLGLDLKLEPFVEYCRVPFSPMFFPR